MIGCGGRLPGALRTRNQSEGILSERIVSLTLPLAQRRSVDHANASSTGLLESATRSLDGASNLAN